MSGGVHYSVDEAALRLKRLFVLEKELLRLAAGYLANVEDWSLKTGLPYHLWEDSLRADFVRRRILELRFPRRDVDAMQEADLAMAETARGLFSCRTDGEFLFYVCEGGKQALLDGYRHYLAHTNPLNDEPTVHALSRAVPDLERQIREMAGHRERLLREKVSLNPRDGGWEDAVRAGFERVRAELALEAAAVREGDSGAMASGSAAAARERYAPPAVPRRDSRFASVPCTGYIEGALKEEPEDDLLERNLMQGLSHANEMWAAETLGAVMWAWDDMPWEFYAETARWLYDESRHCRMGVQRMASIGLEAGVDYPMAGETYAALFPHGWESMLGLLHYFEFHNTKQESKEWFESRGDRSSTANMDYDWADEAIHLAYGYKWLLHRLGGDGDRLEEVRDQSIAYWNEWYREHVLESPIRHFEPFRVRMLQRVDRNKAGSVR